MQVVNIQGSPGSTWAEKIFYVNDGLAFDEICHHLKRPVVEKPKEYECDSRGLRVRLEQVVTEAPDQWTIPANANTDAIVGQLRPIIEVMASKLDEIEGISGLRNSTWFNWHRPLDVRALVLYLLGDKAGARTEVTELTKCFKDRELLNEREHWLAELNLTGLDD